MPVARGGLFCHIRLLTSKSLTWDEVNAEGRALYVVHVYSMHPKPASDSVPPLAFSSERVLKRIVETSKKGA